MAGHRLDEDTMSNTLYLYLGADWPQQSTVCAWRLERGKAAPYDGESPPARWPTADRYVAVLSAGQVRYSLLTLPPGIRWDDPAALAMAVEEQLAAPVEQQVVVPVRKVGDATCCAIIQRARLTTLLACFAELKMPLSRVECEADKLESPDQEWRIYQTPHGDWLHDGSRAIALDAIESERAPVVLQLALAEAGEMRPKSLFIAGGTAEHAERLARQLHVDVQPAAKYAWQAHCANPGINLLMGDLAPRSRLIDMPRMRVAAALLVLAFAGTLGQDVVGWMRATLAAGQLRDQQLALLRSSGITESPGMGRPDQLMRAAWATARARVGEPGAEEFLPMLSALASTMPSRAWSRIEFTQDKLVVNWQGNAEDAARVETKLGQSGYQSVSKPQGDDQMSTALRFGGEP
jgi:type II secretory pathway component PulL